MHIMEGFLPGSRWQIWWILAIPVLAYGTFRLNRLVKEKPDVLLLAFFGILVGVSSTSPFPPLYIALCMGFATVYLGKVNLGKVNKKVYLKILGYKDKKASVIRI